MKINRPIAITSGVVIAIILIFIFSGTSGSDEKNLVVPVKQGEFVVSINTTGELEAKNSVKIQGPAGVRRFRVWNMKIQSLVDEGTYVKKGDFVASLDPSELTGKMNEIQIELDEALSQYTQVQLDTTLEMRESREELINLDYALQEAKLKLDQSQYEPPAAIKQAEINYEKAKRKLEQANENYFIKQRQNSAKMQEQRSRVRKKENELDEIQGVISSLRILAPEDGMIIYHKSWDGVIKEGSQINAWDPTVATLPDLSRMISKTYVNEVDIRRIAPGQKVEIGLDAFPEKKLTGTVANVANVGEQKPNSDAKVFLVNIDINEKDELLRPAMTTSNNIITRKISDAVYVPLESLNSYKDSITYVFKKVGVANAVKQQVVTGETNENYAVILNGLEADDEVYLSKVANMEDEEIELLPSNNSISSN